MSSVNSGLQNLGWKFSTPLQADYLNTFMAGLSGPGLLSRPKFEIIPTGDGADVSIYPFSALIVPTDKVTSYVDENGQHPIHRIVKVTTSAIVKLSVTPSDVAIGFTYSFANQSVTQSQWYGEFKVLDALKLREFDGILIATVQCWEDTTYNRKRISVTSSGADISDALLQYEGWNPNKWLSVISPRRADNGISNKLEIRKHNDNYSGYISGTYGCNKIGISRYSFDTDVDPVTNPDGIRGFMPGNYNLFSLQSDGFKLSDYNDTLPVTKQSGGVFAIVDASAVNLPPKGTGSNDSAFVNKLKISPVEAEDINIYFNENDKTLYLK